jgi:hypothetical protein
MVEMVVEAAGATAPQPFPPDSSGEGEGVRKICQPIRWPPSRRFMAERFAGLSVSHEPLAQRLCIPRRPVPTNYSRG